MDHIGSIFSFGSHSRNSIIVRGDVLSSSSTQESAKLHLRFESMGIWMLRQDWVAAKLDGLNLSTVSRWFYTNYIYNYIYMCVQLYICKYMRFYRNHWSKFVPAWHEETEHISKVIASVPLSFHLCQSGKAKCKTNRFSRNGGILRDTHFYLDALPARKSDMITWMITRGTPILGNLHMGLSENRVYSQL